jgi:hypothetical protein
MGEEMRKEKVTPRGTPPSIKPMNKGTAEQEQKGVTTPRREAKILPINLRREETPDKRNREYNDGEEYEYLDRIIDKEFQGS